MQWGRLCTYPVTSHTYGSLDCTCSRVDRAHILLDHTHTVGKILHAALPTAHVPPDVRTWLSSNSEKSLKESESEDESKANPPMKCERVFDQ